MKTLVSFIVLGMVTTLPLMAKEYSIDNVLRHAKNDKIVVVETKAGKRLWLLTKDDKRRERAVDFLQRRIGGQIKITDKLARRVVKAKHVEVFDDQKDHLGNLASIAMRNDSKKDFNNLGMKKIMSIFKKDQ